MNKSALAISIIFIGLITLSLIFSIFCILYFSWGDLKAIQDGLSTTGSIFGAIATLGAAGVAVYLFNDWKDQHNKQVQSSFAVQVFENFNIFEKNILELSIHILRLESLSNSYDNYELTWQILYKDGHAIYLENLESIKSELDLSFNNLMSMLKNYYIFNNEFEIFSKKNEKYLNKFIEINKDLLPSYRLRDMIIDFEARNIGYKDLKNMIDILDIQPIIKHLNAK